MHYKDWLLMFSSGIFIHLFIDALTCYGTGWYEPFSHLRVTMNVLFVADPFYTISVFVSTIALLIIRPRKNSRIRWAYGGILISTLYIVYAFFNKAMIDSDFKKELTNQKINYNKYFTTPAPLNNFLWYVVAGNDSGFYVGYHSVFDRTNNMDLNFRYKNEDLISALNEDEDLQLLKRFSKGYYTADKINDTLFMNDIRFGTVAGWADPNADFVFRYCLEKNANNDLVIQKGRFKSAGRDALTSLYFRVCGR